MVRRGLYITAHAVARYRERVEACPDDEIVRRLSTNAIVRAATFGARFVRLGGGQRVVIQDGSVVTLLAAGMSSPAFIGTPRARRGRRPLRKMRAPAPCQPEMI